MLTIDALIGSHISDACIYGDGKSTWYEFRSEDEVEKPDIAAHDGPMETEDAMRWALAELSTLARDRAKRYTDQLYAIMNEAAR